MIRCRVIGSIDLVSIVAASVQAPDILVGHIGDHFLELGVFAEEMFTSVGATLGLISLVLTIHGLFHALFEQPFGVLGEQGIPIGTPDDLDDIPPGTAEVGFQLLDDFAIAAHGTIKPLKITVDDEDEIVQFLAPSQTDSAQRFRLVHFAIATVAPDLAPGR